MWFTVKARRERWWTESLARSGAAAVKARFALWRDSDAKNARARWVGAMV